MEPLNGLSSLKIALLIDFDNVLLGIDDPGFDVELVVNALRERGSIVMGRCYGDWYRHNRHRRKLMEQGLELVETPAFGPVIKNSADIRIALDGFEIAMTQHHIDTFCLVSGDSDFLPLIKKLQYLGKTVLVICGNRFTSDMLRRNCNEFISYENLLAQSVGATEDATTLDGAFALLHRAMAALRERGSEIRSSTVKQMMLQLNPTFSERNFGCAQFRGFLDKAVAQNLIKLGGRDKVSGEFSVLLPEEDESKLELEAKTDSKPEIKNPEIKNPVVRSPREARAPREPRNIRIPEAAAPLETAPETVAAPLGAEAFEPAAHDETEDHATTSSALLSRGLRRGRLRFSGKTGRPVKVESAAANGEAPVVEETPERTPSDIEALPSSESVTQPAEDAPEGNGIPDLEAIADQVAQTAAEISVGAAPPMEMEVAPAVQESPQAQGDPDAQEAEATKKPARRRRRKTANAEKSVNETEPASEAEAAQNEADANAAGLTFPGKAFDLTEAAEAAPAEPASEPTPEAATEAPAEAEAPAAKPVRRRRTRKKADETPSE